MSVECDGPSGGWEKSKRCIMAGLAYAEIIAKFPRRLHAHQIALGMGQAEEAVEIEKKQRGRPDF